MESNIFEAAANKAKKKSTQVVTSNKSTPSDFKPSKMQGNFQNTYGAEDPEVINMFARMREMRHDLETQLDGVREKGKERQFDVDEYLEKTIHFRPLELEKNIQDQKAFEDKVNSVFPPEACLKKLKKSKEKLTQERKNKSIGSRKKWIPMR